MESEQTGEFLGVFIARTVLMAVFQMYQDLTRQSVFHRILLNVFVFCF